MRKYLLISIVLFFVCAQFTTAQEKLIPIAKKPQSFQTLDDVYINHIERQQQMCFKNTEDWWQPDTVIYHHDVSTKWRVLYNYNESGYIMTMTHQWSMNYENWQNEKRHVYEYDENNNLILYSYQEYSNTYSEWLHIYKLEYTYLNNRLETGLYLSFYNGNWRNITLYKYNYDNSNNLICELEQEYNNNTSNWVNYYQYVYSYDERNNLLTDLAQSWEDNLWIDEVKYIYTYDNKNNITSIKYEMDFDGQWILEEYYEYTYDDNSNQKTYIIKQWYGSYYGLVDLYSGNCIYENNLLVKEEVQEYDIYLQEWNNATQYIYTYYGSNIILHLQNNWNNEVWIEYLQKNYEYDTQNNMIEYIEHNLYWNNSKKYTFEYDDNNNGITGRYFEKDYEEWEPADYKLETYYNSNMSSFKGQYFCYYTNIVYEKTPKPAGIENPAQQSITIYPNPASDYIIISAGDCNIENVQIYNLTGKLVKQEKSNKINIIGLPVGMYIIKVETEGGNFIKKVIKD